MGDNKAGAKFIVAPKGGGGGFTAGGDLAGTSTDQTVIGIQARPVSSAAPSSGQVLEWNGSLWVPTTPSAGGVTSVTAGDASLTATPTTGAVVIEAGTLDQIANLHPPAANWSNNSKKITSLANGSGAQDAAAFGQIPTSLPPSGAAGGSLAGTYPNPTIESSVPLPGSPTTTTQSPLDNSTKVATTAYADSAVGVETSRAEAAEALLAPLASPALTGVPTAPTAAPGTNTTQLATTAFVIARSGLYLPLAGGTMSGVIAMGANKITGLANGSGAQDGAAFGQIPTSAATIGGLLAANNLSDVADAGSSRFHLSSPTLSAVAAQSSVNVNIAAPGATMDGYSLLTNDEVLLTGQSTPSQNGVWTWNGAAAALTRPNEYPSGGVVKRGRTVAVINGGTWANTLWVLNSTAAGITIDTTAQTWAQAVALPGGAAGGDLTGFYPNPTVKGLQGVQVGSSAPATGQSLAYNGSTWTPTTITAVLLAVTFTTNRTAGAGEASVFTGSTAAQTLTLPTAPQTGVVNELVNTASVPVTLSRGGSTDVIQHYLTGSLTTIVIPSGMSIKVAYDSSTTTWYVIDGGFTPSYLLATQQYAPVGLANYAVAATTITALDTTNLTLAFTVGPSGIVDVDVQFTYALGASDTLYVALLNHTGGALLGNAQGMNTTGAGVSQQIGGLLRFHLTGLTPGALQVDFAGGKSAAVTTAIYAVANTSKTVASNTAAGPIVIQARAAA